MKKPTLRLFADYACSIPLWEDGVEYSYGEILDGSQEQLIEMGVSKTTLALMESLCFTFENGSKVEDYNTHWEEGRSGDLRVFNLFDQEETRLRNRAQV